MKRRQLGEVPVKVRCFRVTSLISAVPVILMLIGVLFSKRKSDTPAFFVGFIIFMGLIYIVFRIREFTPLWMATFKPDAMWARSEVNAYFGLNKWVRVPWKNVRVLKSDRKVKWPLLKPYPEIKIEYQIPGQNEKRRTLEVGEMDECFPKVVKFLIRNQRGVRFSPKVLEAVKLKNIESAKNKKEWGLRIAVVVGLLTAPILLYWGLKLSLLMVQVMFILLLLIIVSLLFGWERFKACNQSKK
jgi:hypothetical protein